MGTYSIRDLREFLDTLTEERLLAESEERGLEGTTPINSIRAFRVAVNAMEPVLADTEKADVRTINLETLADRIILHKGDRYMATADKYAYRVDEIIRRFELEM